MHDLDAESVENQTEADGPISVEGIFLEDGSLTSCTEIFEKLQKTLSYEALNLLLGLRWRGNVPFNVSLDVVNSFSRIMAMMIQQISLAIETELKPQLDERHQSICNIKEGLSTLKDAFKEIQSEHRIRIFYENYLGFVSPQSSVIGNTFEISRSIESDRQIVSKPVVAQ